VFKFEDKLSLGELHKLRVWHDSKGFSAGECERADLCDAFVFDLILKSEFGCVCFALCVVCALHGVLCVLCIVRGILETLFSAGNLRQHSKGVGQAEIFTWPWIVRNQLHWLRNQAMVKIAKNFPKPRCRFLMRQRVKRNFMSREMSYQPPTFLCDFYPVICKTTAVNEGFSARDFLHARCVFEWWHVSVMGSDFEVCCDNLITVSEFLLQFGDSYFLERPFESPVFFVVFQLSYTRYWGDQALALPTALPTSSVDCPFSTLLAIKRGVSNSHFIMRFPLCSFESPSKSRIN